MVFEGYRTQELSMNISVGKILWVPKIRELKTDVQHNLCKIKVQNIMLYTRIFGQFKKKNQLWFLLHKSEISVDILFPLISTSKYNYLCIMDWVVASCVIKLLIKIIGWFRWPFVRRKLSDADWQLLTQMQKWRNS